MINDNNNNNNDYDCDDDDDDEFEKKREFIYLPFLPMNKIFFFLK